MDADTASATAERLSRLRALWEAGGVVLAHPRDAAFQPERGSGVARLQPTAPLHGTSAAVGDLVALVSEGCEGQELRRVAAIDPSPWGGAPSYRLGPPVPRREWPLALRSPSDPLPACRCGLQVRKTAGRIDLLDADGGVVAAVEVPHGNAENVRRQVERVIASAAALGAADADASFKIVRAGPGMGRRWLVMDSRGGTLYATARGFLERHAPPHVHTVRSIAERAYAAARDAVAPHAALGAP